MIKVYGKPGCGKCDAAKDKLKRMGLDYEEHTLSYHVEHHPGWRIDGSTEICAANALMDTMPLIEIEGKIYDYSAAMKVLKSQRHSK